MSVSIATISTNVQYAPQWQQEHSFVDVASVIDSLPAGILVLNKKGVIVEQNAIACEWLNQNVISQSWSYVVERYFQLSKTNQDLRLSNGRIVSISTNPLNSGKGQTILLTDVSEQRKLQSKQDQQSRLVLMGEMLATLAHQVRTPLTSSMLYFSQAKSDTLPATIKQSFIEKGIENLKHLETMISELLMFSKGGEFNARWISVNKALAHCKQQVSPILTKHHCQLNISNKVTAFVKANDDALASALINIVENAIVHNEQPVTISIDLEETKNKVLIAIKNNGLAIPNTVKGVIFTAFLTTRSNGTGLGLSIVKTIIESFGGSIHLSKNNDNDVAFLIELNKQQGA